MTLDQILQTLAQIDDMFHPVAFAASLAVY